MCTRARKGRAIPIGTSTGPSTSFLKGGSDGYWPHTLININGIFYGTTVFGGTGSCVYDGADGCGTVFSITLDGKETVLYSFKGGHDGAEPTGAGVVDVKNVLYGTTFNGGGRRDGGTVFSFAPS